MGLFVEFDLIDDFGYTDMTDEFAIIPDYSEGNEVFVETFLQVSKELVPVDTGYLASTLSAEEDDTYCSAWTDCEYAQYPEYGTWCQTPQPYFEPALIEAIEQATPYWNSAEEEAWDEEEMLIEELERLEGTHYGYHRSRGGAGMLNFSSPGAFFGSLLGLFISAIIMVAIEEIFNTSSSGSSFSGRQSHNSQQGDTYIPDVIIT